MARVGWAVLLALSACRPSPGDSPPDPSASPQAKAEPAPIASPALAETNVGPPPTPGSPGSPPPIVLRPDEPPPPDTVPRDAHEVSGKEAAKDAPAIYSVTYALRSSDVAQSAKAIELSAAGVEAARRKSEPSLTVDLMPGHARAVLLQGFVLPDGTELRARADRFGYVVVRPEADSYRVASSGALRALLGEGLFDAAPQSLAEVISRGEGARRLGRQTRRVEVTTRVAKGSFELAHVADGGDGGSLVCRIFLDLMSAKPGASPCADGEVPIHVELRWTLQPPQPGGRARVSGVSVFEAVSLNRRSDLSPTAFLAPPPTAQFIPKGEPVVGAHLFLTHADLIGLRFGSDPSAHTSDAPAALSLHNSTDELRYAWLDGVPLAWLAPGGRLDVMGLPHTKATVQWRTFLGDAIDTAETVTLPATVDALPLSHPPPTSADNPPP